MPRSRALPFSNCWPFIWRPGSTARWRRSRSTGWPIPTRPAAAAGPRDGAARACCGKRRAAIPACARETAPRAGGRDRVGARSGADRADAGSVAGAAGEFRRLRAETHRDPAGVCRRQSAGAHHVRRRSARPRGGHRGAAVRRALRQAAGPDDRGDRARPQQGLHRQRHSVAAARQPHADAAGDADLPAVHPAADRTGESRTCW